MYAGSDTQLHGPSGFLRSPNAFIWSLGHNLLWFCRASMTPLSPHWRNGYSEFSSLPDFTCFWVICPPWSSPFSLRDLFNNSHSFISSHYPLGEIWYSDWGSGIWKIIKTIPIHMHGYTHTSLVSLSKGKLKASQSRWRLYRYGKVYAALLGIFSTWIVK